MIECEGACSGNACGRNACGDREGEEEEQEEEQARTWHQRVRVLVLKLHTFRPSSLLLLFAHTKTRLIPLNW